MSEVCSVLDTTIMRRRNGMVHINADVHAKESLLQFFKNELATEKMGVYNENTFSDVMLAHGRINHIETIIRQIGHENLEPARAYLLSEEGFLKKQYSDSERAKECTRLLSLVNQNLL